MRRWTCLLIALMLSACAGSPGGYSANPRACDRNGDEEQRRAC